MRGIPHRLYILTRAWGWPSPWFLSAHTWPPPTRHTICARESALLRKVPARGAQCGKENNGASRRLSIKSADDVFSRAFSLYNVCGQAAGVTKEAAAVGRFLTTTRPPTVPENIDAGRCQPYSDIRRAVFAHLLTCRWEPGSDAALRRGSFSDSPARLASLELFRSGEER